MIVFLIILAALVGVGLPLYLLHRADERRASRLEADRNPSPEATSADEEGQSSSSSSLPLSPTSPPSASLSPSPSPGTESDIKVDDEVCCGMHMTCEKDSLLADVSDTIDYFDDEELDRFAGRAADVYSPEEIEEFRDVLLTLLPADIAPWARSIQLRGINLPTEVREELLMIVAEARESHNNVE